MQATVRTRDGMPLVFVALVFGVLGSAVLVSAQMAHAGANAGVVGIALTSDIVAGIPLAFYFLVVRPRRLSVITMLPVVVLSAFAASRIIPAEHHDALRALKLLAVPAEVALLGWLTWRVVRATRSARHVAIDDPLERMRHAALEFTRKKRAAAILATELAVFYYAFFSWSAHARVPAGYTAVTQHQRSGHGALVFAIVVMIAVEALAVHILLREWSGLAAWLLSIGSGYGAMWLIADYRATVLRPILLGRDDIVVRAGLRFQLHVARTNIERVVRAKPDSLQPVVNLTFLSEPTRWVVLMQPLTADGLYGIQPTVRALGLAPDDPELWDDALTTR